MASTPVVLGAPYLAYLRVFEPLEAFDEQDRRCWLTYLDSAPARADVEARERQDAVLRLLGSPPVPLPLRESRDALVIDWEGSPLLCPLQTRLRAWHALDLLMDTLPSAAMGAAIPAVRLEQALAARERYLADGGEVRVRTRTATWELPVAWFTLFGGQDAQAGSVAGPLRYRTPMGSARTRVARALRTLRQSLDGLPVTDEVEEVARWLELFHPRAVVELDCAGMTALVQPPASCADSISDVEQGLATLAEGDALAAAAAYERLDRRWARIRALARSS